MARDFPRLSLSLSLLHLQAHASAAIIQGIWRSVHLQRNRAAGAIQSAWKMRMAKKAFHRDICAVVWMQRQFRRSVATYMPSLFYLDVLRRMSLFQSLPHASDMFVHQGKRPAADDP